MAKFRGIDGSLKVATVALAGLKNWSITSQRAILDTTSMGDTTTSRTLDIGDWSASAEMHLDLSITEQATLFNQVIAGTAPSDIAAVFLIGTSKQLTGNVLVNQAVITNGGKGSVVALAVQLAGDGALAFSWA